MPTPKSTLSARRLLLCLIGIGIFYWPSLALAQLSSKEVRTEQENLDKQKVALRNGIAKWRASIGQARSETDQAIAKLNEKIRQWYDAESHRTRLAEEARRAGNLAEANSWSELARQAQASIQDGFARIRKCQDLFSKYLSLCNKRIAELEREETDLSIKNGGLTADLYAAQQREAYEGGEALADAMRPKRSIPSELPPPTQYSYLPARNPSETPVPNLNRQSMPDPVPVPDEPSQPPTRGSASQSDERSQPPTDNKPSSKWDEVLNALKPNGDSPPTPSPGSSPPASILDDSELVIKFAKAIAETVSSGGAKLKDEIKDAGQAFIDRLNKTGVTHREGA